MKVSVSNEIGYKHHVQLGLVSHIMTMSISPLTLTQLELTKAHCITCRKIVLSPTTSSPVGLYGYGNAGRAASQVWLGMGVQGIGVRGVPGSIPGGTGLLWGVS